MSTPSVLRAPCPACGVVDRVVKATPQGGYRMIRHKAPLQRYQLRASICDSRALIAVAAILKQTQEDRAVVEASANHAVEYREKLREEYERRAAESAARETVKRAELAALDKAIAKLTAAMEARKATP